MPRYRFTVEYLGTAYAGWQIQVGQLSVQEVLERALKVCLRADITLMGSGRTDSGVHARGQVAHFDYPSSIDTGKVQRSLNALTPEDVWVRKLEECREDFHARYDAESRLYHYRIAQRATALEGGTSWFPGFPLDGERLRSELGKVVGVHNFVNFSVPREDGKSTECKVLRADVVAEGIFLIVVIEANRFLHKMVRSIVGASFDVARKARPPGLTEGILDGSYQGEWTWAPARGLCLEKVIYKDYDG